MEPVTSRAFPGANKFKLGLFSFNTGGGLTQTLAPERWDPSWTHMVQLAREAEAAGLEFLLPLAGWIDHQGAADNDGHFHETITWAGGLLAATERIHVFATIHVPFLHPVFAAKQAVTCDHIGGGRFGLNLVAGYNIQEFDMFGIDYGEHEARYAYLDEWLHVVKRLWQEPERFDHEGRFFQVKAAFSQPKPVDCGLPMVVSAGSSPTGREFALTKADALFMVVPELDSIAENLAGVRLAMGPRPINVYCSGHIFCRATKQETEDYYHYLIHETGDWAAGRFLLKSYEEIHSMPREILHSDPFIERLMSGSGTLPVVGDPDHVVDTFKKLNAAGISGMAFALPNYLEDFKIIREEVLPRMEAAGLREPWV